MSKTLVVGGAGYIGSHMVLHLLDNNVEVVILDNLSMGSKKAILGGTFYQGDLSDRMLLKKIFSEHSIDSVMHFAAFIQVGESVQDPHKYYVNNISNTLILLDEMRIAKVNNFVFSSTAAIYGEPSYIPIDISHPKDPVNPYGHTKLVIEQVLDSYAKAYGLNSTILRYFNAAGSDPKGRIGFHEPITHLIPQVLKAASGRKPYVKIFGINYDTKDGSCIRDYIHVMDLVSAHLLALKEMKNKNINQVFNLGNGLGFSVIEVIDTVKRVTGKSFEVQICDRRAGDPAKLIADASLAKNTLNWEPKFSSIENIIKDAWLWELTPIWHI